MIIRRSTSRQAGAVIVEFALSFLLFWLLFMGALEFGRLMFAWNAAAEATKIAARVGSVCGRANEGVAKTKAGQFLRATGLVDLTTNTSWASFTYYDQKMAICSKEDCTYVEVAISGLTAKTFIPLPASASFTIPANRILMLREAFPKGGAVGNDYCV